MGATAQTQTVGPDAARLTIRTTKGGAAAKAGHNLLIEVGRWSAKVTSSDGAPSALEVSADSRSLRVIEGTGGIKPLTDDDRSNITQTIDDEVLRGCPIEFRSTEVKASADRVYVVGELELAGRRRPLAFTLRRDEAGRLRGSATVRQSDWGMKPYSALFGTLKVGDDVEVVVETDPLAA